MSFENMSIKLQIMELMHNYKDVQIMDADDLIREGERLFQWVTDGVEPLVDSEENDSEENDAAPTEQTPTVSEPAYAEVPYDPKAKDSGVWQVVKVQVTTHSPVKLEHLALYINRNNNRLTTIHRLSELPDVDGFVHSAGVDGSIYQFKVIAQVLSGLDIEVINTDLDCFHPRQISMRPASPYEVLTREVK